jgi:flagellar FliG-like protein
MQRNELLAALCVMNEGENARSLFAFSSENDEKDLSKIADRLLKEGDVDASEVFARIRKARGLTGGAGFSDIHPGWILEKLEGESPRVLGILCRFLTGDKIKYLIEHLPESRRKLLPKVNESYKVAAPVAEIVRALAEKKLTFVVPVAGQGGAFSFPHLTVLKTDDLRTLFRDLGLEEIRKAFKDVEPQVLRAFLARFVPKMAREIRERIDHGGSVAPEIRSEAQRHLISLPLEKLPVEDLFREIGYSSFAHALEVEDMAWADMVYHKLPPEEGYRLKRILQETVKRRAFSAVEARRQEILRRIASLAKSGAIRKYWKGDQ